MNGFAAIAQAAYCLFKVANRTISWRLLSPQPFQRLFKEQNDFRFIAVV